MMKTGKPGCLVLFLACSLCLQAGLTFETTHVELESGYLDERLEVEFPFRNTGDSAVTITRMESSCGCTVPTLEKRTYQPGETGVIEAVFNFGPRTGHQKKNVTVHTNDPGQPLQRLSFETRIPRWATLQPHMLHWRKGDTGSREVVLLLADPATVRLVNMQETLNHFEVEKTASGDGRHRYTVTPKAGTERATERIVFVLEAGEGEERMQRDFTLFCLVR